ncbi:DnaJ C-terminal domain-containing protein [Pajaroellobacter abortibovis]|uniref:J domain-containing protein n=1 Tax=Pajaroellobacter abortibovis TaxID=1882918 RepID=A0A1L6MYL4_9BACT|nr:J domain-containing protein [Pajaroellobacter abortibovis]APS00620.1 hypothetical protein BCY86_08000 [Pajaroellobacter abortibovis]
MAQDLYAVLGVPRDADAETIKKAYRKLAKELHPDRNPGDAKAEARFKNVNQAFQVLSNHQKKRLYDEFGEEGLREGFDPERVRQYQQWASRGGRGGTGGGFSVEDLFQQGGVVWGGQGVNLGDLFGEFVGRGGGVRAKTAQRGEDLESEVTLDFASAIRGTTLNLRSPSNPSSSVTVRIPAGACEGSRVRIAGQGGPPPRKGGVPGDLVLTVYVKAHPCFWREKDDLHVNVPITVTEAYYGAKVTVPTVNGSVIVKVPERVQGGTVLRLRGKGIQVKGKPNGDLYVHFQVRIPTSDGAAEWIEKLKAYEPSDIRADLKL